jgi:hypothetical protein
VESSAEMRTLFYYSKIVFEYCGMRLRASPEAKEYKEKVRAKKNDLLLHMQR